MPFYVAAPLVDRRPVRRQRRRHPHRGARPRRGHRVPRAARGARRARAPGTPPSTSRRHAKISAIITEVGVLRAALRQGAASRLPRAGSAPDARHRGAQGHDHGGRPGHAAGAAHRSHGQADGADRQPAGHGAHPAPAGAPRRDRGLRQPAPLPRRHPRLLRRRPRVRVCAPTTASKTKLLGTAGGTGGFRDCWPTTPSWS